MFPSQTENLPSSPCSEGAPHKEGAGSFGRVAPFGASPFFCGILVAVATPYKSGKIDEKGFTHLLENLLQAGVQGVVPCGTTGEALALSFEERGRLIQIAVDVCRGHGMVVPGTGAPTFHETVAYTRQAQDLKADAALVVTPYFVTPDPQGLLDHYGKLQAHTDVPLLLYHNPKRTGVTLSVSLVEEIAAQCSHVRGLKDSSPDLARPTLLREVLGPSFALLSGEDGTFAGFLAQGGDGLISVGANLFPQVYVRLFKSFQRKDMDKVRELQSVLSKVASLLFQAPSPGPLKYALMKKGIGDGTHRLPLGPLTASHKAALDALLEKEEV
jgi:4-hydroxy-tetrahydrodipicolinate synthase